MAVNAQVPFRSREQDQSSLIFSPLESHDHHLGPQQHPRCYKTRPCFLPVVISAQADLLRAQPHLRHHREVLF